MDPFSVNNRACIYLEWVLIRLLKAVSPLNLRGLTAFLYRINGRKLVEITL
jgi:hypothetical protein